MQQLEVNFRGKENRSQKQLDVNLMVNLILLIDKFNHFERLLNIIQQQMKWKFKMK